MVRDVVCLPRRLLANIMRPAIIRWTAGAQQTDCVDCTADWHLDETQIFVVLLQIKLHQMRLLISSLPKFTQTSLVDIIQTCFMIVAVGSNNYCIIIIICQSTSQCFALLY